MHILQTFSPKLLFMLLSSVVLRGGALSRSSLRLSVGPKVRWCTTSSSSQNVLKQIELVPEEKNLFDLIQRFCRERKIKTVVRVAGGWVRDKLLGQSHKYDVDLALDNMTGKQFSRLLMDWMDRQGNKDVLRLGVIVQNPDKSKHLETVSGRFGDIQIDIVNLRTESYNKDSRVPVISIGTAEEDAYRRDLTINTLFYNLNTGQIEDITGQGIKDLQSGVIRTPLAPLVTLTDDPLRALRVVRFACRFGFSVVDECLAACKDHDVNNALRNKVSIERINAELSQMLEHRSFRRAVLMLHDAGLLACALALPDDLSMPPVDPQQTGTSTPVSADVVSHFRRNYLDREVATLLLTGLPVAASAQRLVAAMEDGGDAQRAFVLSLLTSGANTLQATPGPKIPRSTPLADYLLRDWLRISRADLSNVASISAGRTDLLSLLAPPTHPAKDFMECYPDREELVPCVTGGRRHHHLSALGVGLVSIEAGKWFLPALHAAVAEQAMQNIEWRVRAEGLCSDAELWRVVKRSLAQTLGIAAPSALPTDDAQTREAIMHICREEYSSALAAGEVVLDACDVFGFKLPYSAAQPFVNGVHFAEMFPELTKKNRRLIGEMKDLQTKWQLCNPTGTQKDMLTFFSSVYGSK